MDRFAMLDAFCRVVEAGSFSGAAAQRDVAHTVMSRQVRALEKQLGTQLLNRTTRGITLTEAGRQYHATARRILADLDEADLNVSQYQSAPQGLLRISAPVAYGALELAAWLPGFLKRYPDLQVDLRCDDHAINLIDEEMDVALRLAHTLPDSTMMARRLGKSELAIVAAPSYLADCPAPERPEDLSAHRCLLYTLANQPGTWRFSANRETIAVTVRGHFRANTSIALRAAALGGAGIALVPAFLVRQDIACGNLVSLLETYAMPARELFALYPRNRHMPPKVRAFIDYAAGIHGSAAVLP